MLEWWWWIIPGAVGVIGLAFALSGLGYLFRGRTFKGGRGVLGGSMFMSIAAITSLLGLNIQTYHNLTWNQPIATIEVKKLDAQHFQVTVTDVATEDNPTPGPPQIYDVHGDQWRMEARVLVWKPWARILGLTAQYRLDRLSGRYADTVQERSAERSVYDIRPERQSGIDLWPIARDYTRYVPLVETRHGSGTYQPMVDGATYEVRVTQDGLSSRATNETAERASSSGWD